MNMGNKLMLVFGFMGARLLFFPLFVLAEVSKTDAAECPMVKNKAEFMFTIDNKCYHYIEKPDVQVTFDAAQPDCSSRGGHLVTIKDNDTQAELVSVLQQKFDSHTVLIGLRRIGDSWKWVTGEQLTYNNWKGTCQECDCAKLKLREEGLWEMVRCQTTDWFTAYVCEYEPASSSNESSHNNIHPVTYIILVSMAIWKVSKYFLD